MFKKTENFSAEKFAEWLCKGINDLRNGKVEAFHPLHYLIGKNDDIISDLSDIYDTLSGEAQKRFQNGIVLNLQRYPEIKGYVARNLLYLAERIGCLNILPVINSWVKQGKLFYLPEWDPYNSKRNNYKRASEERQEFFALVLNIVAELTPAHGAVHTLRKLIGVKELFYYSYAPMVFIALCRAEPEKIISHLDLLRDHFRTLYLNEGYTGTYTTARRIVHYVAPEIIARNLWQFKEEDQWLLKALFSGNQAPLTIVRKNKEEK